VQLYLCYLSKQQEPVPAQEGKGMSEIPKPGPLPGELNLDQLDQAAHSADRTVFDPTREAEGESSDRTRVDRTQAHPTPQDRTIVRPGPGAAPDEPQRALPAKPAAASVVLPVGYRLHEYRIDGVLGQGGFGIAYAATDVNLNAKVVIKEYLPEDFAYRSEDATVAARTDQDQEFYQAGLDAFLVEARTLATFRHRHIVRVARFFEANRTAYMVLEYERGQSLKTWRKAHESVPESTIVSLLAPLLDGLEVVHKAGFLHRDIKPDNIYVRDEDGSLVLLDFGAARQTAIEVAEVGAVVTPGYGPVEQYAGGGRQGPWTDIYAMGATLFWLVSGRKPPAAPERLEHDTLPSAATFGDGRYSAEFLRAIDWALRLKADDRPRDIASWRSVLFAAHPGALGLQEALRAYDEEGTGESWSKALGSGKLVKARLARFFRALRRPASWPIAVKMTTAMVATALVPMFITANYALDVTLGHLSEVELRNLEQLAQSNAGRIAQLIGDSRYLADYVATDDDFVAFLARPSREGHASILSKLDGLSRANPDIQFAMVMDKEGNALAASNRDVMGRNFRFREYFRKAIEGHGHMTGIIVGSTEGKAGVYYSRPVYGTDKAIIGAVVLRILSDPVARILEGARVGSDRVPFLVDGDGVIIWHPDAKQMFRSLVPLPKAKLDEILADQRFRRPSIESIEQPELATAMVGAKGVGHVSYFSKTAKRDEIAGFAPVSGHDWVVGVSESRDYFAAPIDRLFKNVLYAVLLVGTIFVILALFFARSIVRPIQRLTAAAHALKSGDYGNANIAVRTNDEVGQLARTFNVMIDVLRQRERELGRGRAATLGYEKDPPK
jgi:HAMP domain-containing protein